MKIEIWSDVVCPFCFIGIKRLELALEQVPEIEADIIFRSFELDPEAPREPKLDIYDTLAKKYGQSRDWAREVSENVREMALKLGLEFNFEEMKPTNSFDAHQLLHLAKSEGVQKEIKESLFHSFFIEAKNIADHKLLIELGTQQGLDAGRIKKALEEDEFANAVNHDILKARNIGIQGVPFFLLKEKFGLSGAQPVDTMAQALQEVQKHEGKLFKSPPSVNGDQNKSL